MSAAKASNSADDSNGDNRKSSRGQAPRWLPLACAALALVLIALLGLYGLRVFRGASFNDERAFRVLNEIEDQLGNFQSTIASLPDLDLRAGSNKPNGSDAVRSGTDRIPSRAFAVQGLDVVTSECRELVRDAVSFEVDLRNAERGFAARKCMGNRISIEVQGNLHEHLPQFVEQRYFDTVVIAPERGPAIASLAREIDAGPQVRLHPANAAGLSIVDASGLLQHAAQQEEKDDSVALNWDADAATPSADAAPSHPLVFNETIAGQSYRVFVQPFEPTYPIKLVNEPPLPVSGNSLRPLYLIGLKELNTFESFAAALGARGANAVTLFALFTIMAWPLLSLRLLPTHDPISRTQFLMIVSALVAVPAILACAAFTLWSTQRLTLWADRGAEVYAREIERSLLEELSLGAKVLDQFAQEVAVQASGATCKPQDLFVTCPTGAPIQTQLDPNARIRTAAPLNMGGRSSGFVRNTFGPSGASAELDLDDRQYFKAIRDEQGWPPGGWEPGNIEGRQLYRPPHGLVAQRLFNRSDAARVLQIAVPIEAQGGQRIGVVTGDSRAYALANAAVVPVLRFAVIDNATGGVIFHSDDGRSLAENFFVETERNPRLLALMSKRSSGWTFSKVRAEDHFDGSYLGEPHRFFHRPLAGVPWSVVVMYSTDTIAAVVRQATLAAITAYFALAIAVLIILLLAVLMARGRPDREILAWLWPKWRARDRYVQFAAAAWVVLGAVLLAWLLREILPSIKSAAVIAIVVFLSVAVMIWLLPWMRRRAATSLHAYQNSFVICLLCVLIAVGVAPAGWLAARYHDAALRDLIETEFRAAGEQISKGHAVVASDLLRWTANAPEQRAKFDSWNIVKERFSPGYVAKVVSDGGESAETSCTAWAASVFPSHPWLTADGALPLGLFLHVLWSWSSDDLASRGWARPAGGPSAAESATNDPCAGSTYLISSRSRTQDGRRVIVGMKPDPQGAAAAFKPEYDADSKFRHLTANIVLVAVGIALGISLGLVSWHVSRRLFAIRIPFASRYLAPGARSVDTAPLLDAEFDLLEHAESRSDFTMKDEMDWRIQRCKAHYRAMWDALNQEEQLLLHQLAKGGFANPENQSVIERLIARGYLTLRPWIRIVDVGFETFATTAEPEGTFAKWHSEASHGTWTAIRTPLLVIVVVVALILMWLAGSAMQIFSAILVGVAALCTSITQVTGFLRNEGRPLPSRSGQ